MRQGPPRVTAIQDHHARVKLNLDGDGAESPVGGAELWIARTAGLMMTLKLPNDKLRYQLDYRST